MSRVHDALRRAEQLLDSPPLGEGLDDEPMQIPGQRGARAMVMAEEADVAEPHSDIEIPRGREATGVVRPDRGMARTESKELHVDWRNFLSRCSVIPFHPAPEAHLIDVERPQEIPGEEFRSLRTRLNHMQTQQDLHAIVVTSASP